MTIKEFATLQGISAQAVYKKLQKAGIKTSELTTGETGELSEDGEKRLFSIYNANNQQNTLLKQQVERLTEQVERLAAQLEQAQKREKEARDELQALKQAAEVLQIRIEAEQKRAQSAEENAEKWYGIMERLITPRLAAGEQTEKRHWWNRKKDSKN